MNDNKVNETIEWLKEYFKTTSKEQILKDWDSAKQWDNVGMNVDDFLELQKRSRDLEKRQKDMPDGFNKIIDDNLFDLI